MPSTYIFVNVLFHFLSIINDHVHIQNIMKNWLFQVPIINASIAIDNNKVGTTKLKTFWHPFDITLTRKSHKTYLLTPINDIGLLCPNDTWDIIFCRSIMRPNFHISVSEIYPSRNDILRGSLCFNVHNESLVQFIHNS